MTNPKHEKQFGLGFYPPKQIGAAHMDNTNITPTRLREVFEYNPQTGTLTWKYRPSEFFKTFRAYRAWNAIHPGKEAGHIHSSGYRTIQVDGKYGLAHRAIWAICTGSYPVYQIDHINGIRSDNRLANLRDVPQAVNLQNLRQCKRTQDLPMGVFFNPRKKTKCFSASLRILGKTKHLGYFDSIEEAHLAYLTSKRIHHVGCTI